MATEQRKPNAKIFSSALVVALATATRMAFAGPHESTWNGALIGGPGSEGEDGEDDRRMLYTYDYSYTYYSYYYDKSFTYSATIYINSDDKAYYQASTYTDNSSGYAYNRYYYQKKDYDSYYGELDYYSTYQNDKYNYQYSYTYTYRESNGNHDSDEAYLGGQDWDTWHVADGQHEDDDTWTGDINDFLQGEGDRDHDEVVWSADTGMTFRERLAEIFTSEHEHHAIEHDLSWVTWAEEDVDFWEWFWLWYADLDETWTFDHEEGFVATDPDFEWEWFQNHTSGFNATHDDTFIDRDDSEQWNWESWDTYWRNYDAVSFAPEGFMYHGQNKTEALALDEDQVCAIGSYPNEGNTCQPCPPGCASCTSLGHCLSCDANFEAVEGQDFGFCFPKCFHGQYRRTFYADPVDLLVDVGVVTEEERATDLDMKLVIPPHLMMATCKACHEGCRGCLAGLDGAQFCYECTHGFVYDQANATCVVDPLWNSTESQVSVRASKRYFSQCDEVKVRIDGEAGFNATEELQDIHWNIFVSGMDNDEEINFAVQRLIRESSEKHSFIITSDLTSRLAVGASLKIVGFAAGKEGITVTDEEVIELIDPPAYQLEYQKQFFVLAEEGVTLELTKLNHKCPADKQESHELTSEDWSRLSCTLYSIERQFIADLTDCAVGPNVLQEGQAYTIELEWTPQTTGTAQRVAEKTEKHRILVQTQTTKTICHFEQGDSMLVDSSISHSLRPVIQGQNQLISRTSWSCEVIDSNQPCPEVELEPTTAIQTTKFVPAGYLPQDSILRYTLKLETETDVQIQKLDNSVNSFEVLDQCSIDLQTIDETRLSPVELHIFDEVPLIGFLDPAKSHTFFCGPPEGNPVLQSDDVQYDMQIELLSEDEALPRQPLADQVKTTFDSLTISAAFLSLNMQFKVSCAASNESRTKQGFVSKIYNTYDFPDSLRFRVSPARGAALDTVFSFEMVKPPSEALNCEFGYHNDVGEVLVKDLSEAGQRYSSQKQHLQTTLPSPSNGSNVVRVFARCRDVLGRQKSVSVPVTIEGGDSLQFNQDTTDRFVEQISRNIASGAQTRVSDLVVFASTVKTMDASQFEEGQMKRSVQTLTQAISMQQDIDPNETQQISQVLRDLSEVILQDEELSADPSLTQSTFKAVSNVLSNDQQEERSDEPTEYATISQQTFDALAQAIDVTMTASGRFNEAASKDAAVQATDQLFNQGINRLAGSMQAGIEESAEKSFSGLNFSMKVQKKSKEEFAQNGVNQIEVDAGTEESLKVDIPYDPLFEQVDDFVFATSFSSETGSDQLRANQQSPNVQSSDMLSGLVSVSARATETAFSSSESGVVVSEIEVKDLQSPIQIQIPLNEGLVDPQSTLCMYLDEVTGTWAVVGPACQAPQAGATTVTCCSTHLTTFTVQSVTFATNPVTSVETIPNEASPMDNNPAVTVLQEREVTMHSGYSGVIESESGVMSSQLALIAAVNGLLVLFALTGCILDSKQKLIFKPTYKDAQAIQGQVPQPVPNESLRNSMAMPNTAIGTELQSVKVPEADAPASETPSHVQEESKQEAQEESSASPNDVKIQMDAVVEHGKDNITNSMVSLDQRESKIDLQDSQVFDPVNLNAMKKEKAQLKYEVYTKNQSFLDLFFNAFKFYGRLASLFCSFNARLGRAAKALNVAVQVMVLAALVCLFGLYDQEYVKGPGSDWKLSPAEYVAIFFVMRFVQGVLSLGLSRGESTSNFFVYAATFCFLVVYLVCTSLVYQTAERESEGEQKLIVQQVLVCLALELLVWDLLVMPATLACLSKVSKRVLMRFPGLMV